MNLSGRKSILKYLPDYLANKLRSALDRYGSSINELRLRIGRPAVVMLTDGHFTLCEDKIVFPELLNEILEKMCEYSIYSRQDELSQGYLTLPGGHRVGVCGTAAYDKNGNRVIRYISSLNIRFAGEYIGCSDSIIHELLKEKLCGVMIAGPPCSGKTTLIKDIALKLSSPPYSYKTVIVDERCEIAAMYRGIPQCTLGEHCDVLSGYPKAEGILNAVRTLSPDVIVCDEIGGRDDSEALCSAVNAGVVIITTAHACNANELYRRETIRKVLESGAFKRIALLRGGKERCMLDRILEVSENGR